MRDRLTDRAASPGRAGPSREPVQRPRPQRDGHGRYPTIDIPVTRLTDLGGTAGQVALTFDDGPEPRWTTEVLDVLDQTGTPATFFVLGSKIRGYEQTLTRMVRQGCAVEVHGWEHIRMTEQTDRERLRDMHRTADLIREVTGHAPTCLRPPEGRVSAAILDEIRLVGLTPVFWSLHANDWTRPGTAAIEQAIVHGLTGGSVVLLHDGGGDRSQTVAALPTIINAIRYCGFDAVTLPPAPASG
ncbi:MAG: polysaccharide deacetylase family protein [Micromonosporaceae bacterium]|nr:polysaccharide deacetylase family protein [Micromonosporaceae bacterium]